MPGDELTERILALDQNLLEHEQRRIVELQEMLRDPNVRHRGHLEESLRQTQERVTRIEARMDRVLAEQTGSEIRRSVRGSRDPVGSVREANPQTLDRVLDALRGVAQGGRGITLEEQSQARLALERLGNRSSGSVQSPRSGDLTSRLEAVLVRRADAIRHDLADPRGMAPEGRARLEDDLQRTVQELEALRRRPGNRQNLGGFDSPEVSENLIEDRSTRMGRELGERLRAGPRRAGEGTSGSEVGRERVAAIGSREDRLARIERERARLASKSKPLSTAERAAQVSKKAGETSETLAEILARMGRKVPPGAKSIVFPGIGMILDALDIHRQVSEQERRRKQVQRELSTPM